MFKVDKLRYFNDKPKEIRVVKDKSFRQTLCGLQWNANVIVKQWENQIFFRFQILPHPVIRDPIAIERSIKLSEISSNEIKSLFKHFCRWNRNRQRIQSLINDLMFEITTNILQWYLRKKATFNLTSDM